MNAGIVGTGRHLPQARPGLPPTSDFGIAACTDINPASAKAFAEKYGGVAVAGVEEHLPSARGRFRRRLHSSRLPPPAGAPCRKIRQARSGAKAHGRQCQPWRREMIDVARQAGIILGVASQHRFDDSSIFLRKAIDAGRLGPPHQCDAYVKWFRSAEYYSRPIKGSWACEGGGALINQAIHQIDILRWLAGPVKDIQAMWQLGRSPQNRVRGCRQCPAPLRKRRNRRDPGFHRALARLLRTRRTPRHQRHRHRDRRPANHLGRSGRRRGR
jgi:UDP-N-acetyl-2-amino-2-deoxyglucuronate dehydrogenase